MVEKNFFFEITRTIYFNSERSEQFLKQNALLTCSWRFLKSINYIKTIRIQIGKNNWDLETYRKRAKSIGLNSNINLPIFRVSILINDNRAEVEALQSQIDELLEQKQVAESELSDIKLTAKLTANRLDSCKFL